ncbi:hypothetical protein PAAG_01610 [Paracoccidioides lutzii Pb01]|uniref:Uncharacterized protein n=1 Tax=Paracoccidioides lutzii (strain ATCC MYA-826 / Pb01) TaxID=502779 RepID=C1GSW5_PARBA|nr:hypothetical protein PAAG_01610 [Paracoccidioides lutzii Pb01]EEH39148.1 hypothetical protein PAAG_01610 [Paracoccidioides lutzii Pb01]
MDFPYICLLLTLLQKANIPVCIVGELALNYYNPPRVVHDLELCVPARDLELATSIFRAQKCLTEQEATNYNIYTEYKRGFPRFQLSSSMPSFVVLFTDAYYHLNQLEQNIIPPQEHKGRQEYYSKEILDSVAADQVATLPLPRFAPFFTGFCRMYIKKQEATAAIAAEMLVDGLDIDEAWCRKRLSAPEYVAELKFALGLAEWNWSRISDFTPNEVTYFIVNRQEAQRVRQMPGFS